MTATRRMFGQWGRVVAAVSWGTLALAGSGFAQDTKDYFRTNCKSCHTIGGGRLAGPDLKGVLERAPNRDWLVRFLADPKAIIDSGDPYAIKLFEESRRVPMPTAPGMNRGLAERLLDLIVEESAKPESEFKGIQISTEPFTPQDIAAGRAIFLGLQPLTQGGSSCVSCHAMHDIAALGGGRLGPDLTKVYNTLQGRAKLANWLSAPATPTMLPIFKDHPLQANEIHALVAYMEHAVDYPVTDPASGRVLFLVSGLAAATALIFSFDSLWKWRFRGVRQPLVQAGKLRGVR